MVVRIPVYTQEPITVTQATDPIATRSVRRHRHLDGTDLIDLLVPPNETWFIESMSLTMTPGGVDALRYGEIDLYREGNQIWLVQAPSISKAQQMILMCCPNGDTFDGVEPIAGGTVRFCYRLWPDAPLLGGDHLNFNFGNWQIGDTMYIDLQTVEITR